MTSVVGDDGTPLRVRAVGQGARRSSCLGRPSSARDVLHLLLSAAGTRRSGSGSWPRPPDNPAAGLLGFLARQRPSLVPLLRLPERQGHQRDRGHGQAGAQGGRQRPPGQRDRGPGGRNGDLPLVPGSAPLDLSHLSGRRALRRRPGLLRDPAGELLGLSRGRSQGRADLREDAEDDRVLQPDLRLRLSLAEVRPGLGPAPAAAPRAPRPRP